MKFRNFLFRLALIALVVISIGFTWVIWFNPAHMEHRATSDVTVKTTTSTVTHHAAGAFLPTQVVQVQGGSSHVLVGGKNNLSAQIRRNIKGARVRRVGSANKLSSSAYTALVARNNTVQLTYAGNMSWKLFNELYFTKAAVQRASDFEFDRIIVNINSGAVSLANDKQRQVRKVTMAKKIDLVSLNGALSHAKFTYPFKYQRLHGREVVFLQGNVKVPTYTYLLDKQNANHYVTALMGGGTGASSGVDAKQLGNQTVYTIDNNNQRLAVDRDDSMMQYEDFVATAPKSGNRETLRSAYNDMMRLDVNEMDNMSYFERQRDTSAVTFRTYVGGLPIMNNMLVGTVVVTHTVNSKRIDFSGDNPAVAIPTRQTNVTLPATQTVLTQLNNFGLPTDDISDVQLGYDSNKDNGSTQVAYLTPTYYVEVNGSYYDYKDVLNGTVKLTDMGVQSQTTNSN